MSVVTPSANPAYKPALTPRSTCAKLAQKQTKPRRPLMLRAEDNQFLTESGPGTGMGELLRRFWLPVLLSEELPEADGPPKKIAVMGEELLAFRDSRGVVGVIDQHCPHRGANLWLGRVEECGIRCVYHGWKFDTEGACVDMPTSYPDLDVKNHFVNPRARMSSDHMRWIAEDPRPVIRINPHEAGLTIAGGRLTGSDNIYWRIAQFLMPVHSYAPSAMPGQNIFGQSFVPV